ncbi:tellurite resistance protein TerB [Gemmobacter caeni]|uniref:Tellurite resistance protein TerB n=1 Tax=Gemmobacter caeni TaxID=589035 RepID=A0A2T6B930_9RHOB|nr:tellurite resistance TerB family protein [Gemmobacter caeni]PTX52574.1 tellurite resistance protein TerB [Gemmobacter caeni]TWJ02755.1 tellurite resistance protein TerB [Gemmobacter caeni]
MLNWLKDKGNEARARLTAEVSKFRNRTFMEATVASCALVAAADGTISAQEKQKMAGFMRNSDELKHFDMPDVIAFFEKVVGNFDFDAAIGKAEALKVIGRLRGNEEQARVMVRVACAIGASDGDFDEAEKAVVRTICKELGLNPTDFDL